MRRWPGQKLRAEIACRNRQGGREGEKKDPVDGDVTFFFIELVSAKNKLRKDYLCKRCERTSPDIDHILS